MQIPNTQNDLLLFLSDNLSINTPQYTNNKKEWKKIDTENLKQKI